MTARVFDTEPDEKYLSRFAAAFADQTNGLTQLRRWLISFAVFAVVLVGFAAFASMLMKYTLCAEWTIIDIHVLL